MCILIESIDNAITLAELIDVPPHMFVDHNIFNVLFQIYYDLHYNNVMVYDIDGNDILQK